MYALKWYLLNTRMVFRPDEGAGGGGSEAPASAPSSAPDGGGSAGGDVGATPSAAPSTGTSTTPGSSPGAAQEFDWSALGSADDLDAIAIPPEPATPEAPKVEAAPQPVPPPQPQPAQQPTPQTAEATQSSTEADRPLSAADPWRIAEALEANRDMALAHLATTKFALSEQDIKDLDTDVTVAVPKLLARVFLESQVSMQKFLAQAVPGMVQKYNRVSSVNESAEKKFFTAHPALNMNDPQHRATTVRIASLYRQANPGIPLDQLIAEVGPMVMASLRIAGGTPATPTQRAPQAGRSPAGFVPAVNGGGGLSATPAPEDPWAGLGRNYDDA